MSAADQAMLVSRKLEEWPVYRSVQASSPMVAELPSPDDPNRFALMINLVARRECVNLRLIFELTIGAIRWMHQKRYLKPFEYVAVRLFSSDEGADEPERIIILNAPVAGIAAIPVKSPDALLSEVVDSRFDLYWYRDKTTIAP
jgi:hypothetical protein